MNKSAEYRIDIIAKELENNNWEESRKKIAFDLLKKAMIIEESYNKPICEFGIDDIKKVLMYDRKEKYFTASYGYMQVVLNIIREMYRMFGYERDIKVEYFTDIVSNELEGFYTRQEIIDICDLFINPQDKIIVYGLFCGIYGNGGEELLNLKIEDIDFERNIIKTCEKVVHIDDYMKEIINDVLNPEYAKTYYTNIDDNTAKTTRNYYDLNFDNNHIIKPKPNKSNDGGLGSMKVSGLRSRLTRLSSISGYKLSANKITRSGIMHQLNQIKKNWTPNEVKSYLNVHNISGNHQELLRVYNLKYKTSNK